MSDEEIEISTVEKKVEEPIGNFIQLIDSEEDFLVSFDDFLKQFEIPPLDYFIISTFGPQSTGKSTLLNLLFDTDFPTMDQAKGRYQCTKGVYCSYPKAFENVLVFDLEGTDAGVRGDDKSFERKISIFALAASEILIVNNLLTDIGRYVGSNLSLLHTCFQLNIQLFQTMKKDRKTLLLFTLRDYDPLTNFLELKSQIMTSVEDVWSKVMKPPNLKDSKLEDFFDFRFVTLPHFRYRRDDFEKKVADMRNMFQSESESFVYEKEKYSHHIPVSDLPHYLSDMWTVIKENKDVDIPTQRKMLAMFRCDEISMELIEKMEKEKFNQWVKAIQEKKKSVPKLGEKALSLIKKFLNEFDQNTELYLPQVVSDKRAVLDRRLRDKFRMECSQAQLGLAEKNSIDFFKKYVDKKMETGKNKKRMPNFAREMRKVKAHTMKFFETFAKDCFLPDEPEITEKTMVEVREKLQGEIERYAAVLRNQQLALLIEEQKEAFGDSVQTHLKKLLRKPKSDFWDRARKVVSSLLRTTPNDDTKFPKRISDDMSGEEQCLRKELVEGFECSEEETQQYLTEMKKYIYGVGMTTVRGYVKYLPSEMKKSFENEFPVMNLDGGSGQVFRRYQRGRKAGLTLLNLFFFQRFHIFGTKSQVEKIARQKMIMEGEIDPDSSPKLGEEESEGEDDDDNNNNEKEDEGRKMYFNRYYEYMDNVRVGFPSSEESANPSSIIDISFPELEDEGVMNIQERVILEEDRVLSFYKDFQYDIKIKLIQARSMESKYNIPWWLYLVILGLGWNELWYVLRNPLLLIAIVAAFAVFGWSRLKSYIENGLIDQEFNMYVDFALRRVVTSLPQVFGKDFAKGREEDEEDKDFDGDEFATPDKKNEKARKISYGKEVDEDGNSVHSDMEKDENEDDLRKREVEEE